MTHADLIVTNARITTMVDGAADAPALAIRDRRFVAVGAESEIRAHATERTQVIDAGGRRIIPGLNDSHIHVIRGGLNYNLELRWDGVPSVADALRRLKQQAAITPPPQWVRVVGGWSEFQFE
ncbi:MAG: amidohydrolase family protein, partial [Vicinamibacterales bacterium]